MRDKIDKHLNDNEPGGEQEHKEFEHQEQADTFEKREKTARGIFDFDAQQTVSGKFENPLADIPKHKLFEDVSIMEGSKPLLTSRWVLTFVFRSRPFAGLTACWTS